MTRELILEVEALRKRFVLHARGQIVEIGPPVSLTVSAGEVVVISGPSGAGKSTILKCIYAAYRPTSGVIRYFNADGGAIDLAQATPDEVLALRDREISLAGQDLHCPPRQTAIEVVGRPLSRRGVARADVLVQARDLLNRLHLNQDLHTHAPATFSGGERKCVGLARSVINGPRLLLLDEPSAGLDARRRACVIDVIQDQRRAGAGVLVVTHDDLLQDAVADRIVRHPV